AQVLSLSIGQEDDESIRSATAAALSSNVVVVAAIGNEGDPDNGGYPARYPGVVAVGGVDKGGNHAAVSVISPNVLIAAPAVDIASTNIRTRGSGYGVGTGTSGATAIVAGAVALVRAKFPQLSAAEVVHRLTATADDKGAPGRDDEYGYGIVNLV